MRVAIVGTGYVGLVSGACLADLGHQVTCVDTDAGKIARLRRGEATIFEPGLEPLIARQVLAGRLEFTTDLQAAVRGALVVFIAVGTPGRPEDGRADLTHVLAAAQGIGRALDDYAVVVTKSTVPVGTARKVAEALRAARPGVSADVGSNPEFLREGAALADFMQPDRMVVGVETARARAVMEELYRPFAARGVPILYTGPESAEMTKCAANAFLATKITFINEIAALCEATGADALDVARGMGLDSRIGARFLQPGPGYGGSCLPKDTLALARLGKDMATPLRIVEAVMAANAAVKQRMVARIVQELGGRVEGAVVAVLGATFKPDTDDMRDAPALTILPRLAELGAQVRVTDPKGRAEGEALLPGLSWVDDPWAAARGAELLVVLTEWAEYRELDLPGLARVMARPRMLDLRNLFDPARARAAGFDSYSGNGR